MNEYDHRCQHLAGNDILLLDVSSSGHGSLETIGDRKSVAAAAAAAVEVAAGFAGWLSLVEVSIAAVLVLLSLLLHMALVKLGSHAAQKIEADILNALPQCQRREKVASSRVSF